MTIFRCIRANYIKARHSLLWGFYIVIPVVLAVIFTGYFQTSAWNKMTKVSAFLEMLGIIYPFIIGIVAGMTAQQESRAGHYQFMLGTVPSRAGIYIGEILFLLVNSIVFCLTAVGFFALLFPFAPVHEYAKIVGLLFWGSVPVYLIHFLIAFLFGKNASMGLGIAGCLLAAIMLTGLGDAFWQYIPWAWSARFMDFCVLSLIDNEVYLQNSTAFYYGIIITVIFTFILLLTSIIWIKLWDGENRNE